MLVSRTIRPQSQFQLVAALTAGLLLPLGARCLADAPSAAYIFPAGAQRGTTVEARVGGHFFHGRANFEMLGDGIEAPPEIREVETIWFQGPRLLSPASSRKEDYPKDHLAKIKVDADAPLGARAWRVWTSQGATGNRPFLIGDLPEIVEQEIGADPVPTQVNVPLTINGRIFPGEDVDIWQFRGVSGRTVTIEVTAARLGSPLDARIVVCNHEGEPLAQPVDTLRSDPRLQFTPPADGEYQVKIHDINFGGLQDYVYRLTISDGPYVTSVYPLGGRAGQSVALHAAGQHLGSGPLEVQLPQQRGPFRSQLVAGKGKTNTVSLDIDTLPEHLEAEPNNEPHDQQPIAAGAVLNGRIGTPGDVDYWPLALEQGQQVELDLLAARLGGRLDAVLRISDESGKSLGENDDLASGQPDPRLKFKAPAAGTYWVEVRDRFAARGGERFAYRLKVRPHVESPDFRLRLVGDARRNQAADMVTVFRDRPPGFEAYETGKGGRDRPFRQSILKIEVDRLGGFDGEIELTARGLPPGVTFTGEKIGKRRPNGQLNFSAAHTCQIGVSRFTLHGTAVIDGKEIVREAEIPARDLMPPGDHLLLAVAMPAPFRFDKSYNLTYEAQGSVLERRYDIIRFGFDGPLEARLADRQARHLQGVSGPLVSIPAGASEFTYPVSLPPWMTLGRTSRTCVMLLGDVTDHDGTVHRVSFSSQAQNHQIITILKPALLSVELDEGAKMVQRGSKLELPVRLRRTNELAPVPVQVKLMTPDHARGIRAAPLEIAPDQEQAVLSIEIDDSATSPRTPLTVRATAQTKPHQFIAEAKVELLGLD